MQQAAAAQMTAAQRGCIYGVAGKLGLVERGNKDDSLHVLVYRETGKSSISELSYRDAEKVIGVLGCMMNTAAAPAPTKPKASANNEERPGGITASQQSKVWKLMYVLRDLDTAPTSATLGDRLCGIIRKQLEVDCTAEQPFRFVTMADGWKLIESLKKIVASAQKKRGNI